MTPIHGDEPVSTLIHERSWQPELLRLLKQGTAINAINIDGIDIDAEFEGLIAFNDFDAETLSEGALV